MGGFYDVQNLPNFKTQTIYPKIAPNQKLNNLEVNNLTVSGSLISSEIAILQNPTSGQLISIKLAGTILKNSIQTSIPGLNNLNGPAQDVDVYQVIYYSSNDDENVTVQVSGSLFVPKSITKTNIISMRPGALVQIEDEYSIPWQSLEQGIFQSLTPTQRSGIFFNAPVLSGLGYIILFTDGFSLGINQGKARLLDYFAEVNPSVDMLRAVRPVLPQYGFQGSINPVNIIQYGYSAGGIFGMGVINELQPGVNPNISPAEAQKFNFIRGLFGATPDAFASVNGYLQNYNNGGGSAPNATGTQASTDLAGLYSFSLNNSKNTYGMLRDSWAAQVSNIFDGNWYNTFPATVSSLINQISLNSSTYPPASIGGTDGEYTLIPFCDPGFFDTRQLFNFSKVQTQVFQFKQASGWTNLYRPLNTLPAGVKVSLIYSSVDQVCCPANSLANAIAALGNDTSASLDIYMGAGPTYGLVSYPGAGRNIVANTSSSLVTSSDRLAIANAIKGQTASNYLRYRIQPSGLPGFPNPPDYLLSGSHAGFASYFFDIVVSILA